MDREKIMATIKSLAMSQGFYERLLAALNENPEAKEEFLSVAESKNFKSDVDLVMWIEC